MNQQQKNQIEGVLEELEFVEWDRFVNLSDWSYEEVIVLYGWIPREQDNYKDFLVLHLECLEASDVVKIGDFTTSSEKYSQRINEFLYGEDSHHDQCQRIENRFDVENSIKLSNQGET